MSHEGHFLDGWVEQFNSATTATSMVQAYDEFADSYEQIMGDFQQHGIEATADAANKVIVSKSSRILDFAAGTGLLGQTMFDNGFNNLDALDGSPACLEQAKTKNIYTNLIAEFVTDKISIDDDVYDGLVCCGGFAPNHLPISVFSEWIRCVKPGGYIVNTFRMKWLEIVRQYNKGKLENELKRLEKEGKWKLVRKVLLNNNPDPEYLAVTYVHQVLK